MENMKRTICDLLLDRVDSSAKNDAIGSIDNSKVSFINFKKYLENIECLSIALVNLGLKPKAKACILSQTRKEKQY